MTAREGALVDAAAAASDDPPQAARQPWRWPLRRKIIAPILVLVLALFLVLTIGGVGLVRVSALSDEATGRLLDQVLFANQAKAKVERGRVYAALVLLERDPDSVALYREAAANQFAQAKVALDQLIVSAEGYPISLRAVDLAMAVVTYAQQSLIDAGQAEQPDPSDQGDAIKGTVRALTRIDVSASMQDFVDSIEGEMRQAGARARRIRDETIRTVAVSAAIALGVAVAFSLWMLRASLEEPISRLRGYFAAASAVTTRENLEGDQSRLNALHEMFSVTIPMTDRSDEFGEIARDLVTVRDRYQQLVEDLERTRQILIQQERMASVGRVVAGVAHEINTPLGVAVTMTSFLMDELVPALGQGDKRDERATGDDQIEKAFHLLLANLERTARLVQAFKAVSADQHHEEVQDVDLSAYLELIVESLRPDIARRGFSLTYDKGSPIAASTRADAVWQIVSNLVLNAATHAFPPGERGQISVSLSRAGLMATISVQDDGLGISPEIQSKMFEPFFTTGRVKGGAGLGLAISYNLASALLNGHLSCVSAPGQGARFTLELALDLAAEADAG